MLSKEELKDVEEIKKAIKVVFYEECKKCYFPRRKCANCVRDNRKKINIYIKQLEQKESILDKVTDMLKEIKRELDDDGFGYYAQEVTKILNIVEGDDGK